LGFLTTENYDRLFAALVSGFECDGPKLVKHLFDSQVVNESELVQLGCYENTPARWAMLLLMLMTKNDKKIKHLELLLDALDMCKQHEIAGAIRLQLNGRETLWSVPAILFPAFVFSRTQSDIRARV
jgi:hypothetical protein